MRNVSWFRFDLNANMCVCVKQLENCFFNSRPKMLYYFEEICTSTQLYNFHVKWARTLLLHGLHVNNNHSLKTAAIFLFCFRCIYNNIKVFLYNTQWIWIKWKWTEFYGNFTNLPTITFSLKKQFLLEHFCRCLSFSWKP